MLIPSTVTQTTTEQPAAPQAPAAPSAPEAATAAQPPLSLSALRARRSELSNQINSASERRAEAVEALKNSPPGPARAGLEGRIAVLDQRIMQLETDIAANGQALVLAQRQGRTSESAQPVQRYGPFSSGQIMALSIVSIAMIWGPLAWAAARIMIKRWAHPKPTPQILESSARLERMEQAIDAVAIEVERISEGQRFVTQAMAKRDAVPALGVGQAPAEPIRVPQAESVAR